MRPEPCGDSSLPAGGIAKSLNSSKSLSATHFLASVESTIRAELVWAGQAVVSRFQCQAAARRACLAGSLAKSATYSSILLLPEPGSGRMVAGSLANGVSAAISGGDFGRTVLLACPLQGLSLKHANTQHTARRAMVARSLINCDNAG